MNGSNAASAGDLSSFLRIAAAERPSQPAYVFGSDAIPFKELHEDSDICARGLAILGIKSGDRVADNFRESGKAGTQG